MLKYLFIRNYALIEKLELTPHSGFNVITGETGAGKSIILGALGLLLGKRADKKVLFDEQNKCVVEAQFNIEPYQLESLFEEAELDYEPQTTVRREITANGKSRAFINDTPVTLEVLSSIMSKLIDIHSQNDNLLLSAEDYQRYILDAYTNNTSHLKHYQTLFKDYQKKLKHYQDLLAEQENAQKDLDYHQFLLSELQKAQLQPDEQEILEQELSILENAEELKSKLSEVLVLLQEGEWAITESLRNVIKTLEKLASYASIYEKLCEQAENSLEELKDIAQELERQYEAIEYNPRRIEQIQTRLDEIERLQKKHKVSDVGSLLAIEKELAEKVNRVLNFDEAIAKAQQQYEQALAEVKKVAQQLSEVRKKGGIAIEQDLANLFADLGMPNAQLRIDIQQTELNSNGADKVTFLFSANKGVAPQEIKSVASGGEFSRLMLAIKYILASKTTMPTLIFDEIDTGISGEIALKIAKMMQEMSKNYQIITITHLHQIAAKAEKHYFVYKEDTQERTFSRIKELTPNERIQEIATMISGTPHSEAALESAKELLQARNEKPL